jgi:hypothetical protein
MMYGAMRWPSARPASVAYRKCHPSLTRESAYSAAAAAKLPNVRVGISGGAVVVVIVNDTSLPNASASTPNEAAHAAAWAEEYSGNGGVGRNGSQRASATVFWLPSVSAARIAVYGREPVHRSERVHLARLRPRGTRPRRALRSVRAPRADPCSRTARRRSFDVTPLTGRPVTLVNGD